MKIVFTGGSTGGHFYPLMAVAKAVRDIAYNERLLEPELYHVGPKAIDERLLFEHGVRDIRIPAGKIRRYFSIKNVFDVPKTLLGIVRALWTLFRIYPDVVFSKGSYASVPVVIAARLLRIPVVIHESDSVPGRANRFAAKFARRIAISYPSTASYFDEKKVALTGSPVRKEVRFPVSDGSYEIFGFETRTPIILFLGGSQGAKRMNGVIVNALPDLVARYQVLHQTGQAHLEDAKKLSAVTLDGVDHAERYKPVAYFDVEHLRRAAGVASVIVSRAGSTIFEIAHWGKPSIIVPIPEEISHDQRSNAFSYARTGAAHVIEEENLTPAILVAEINRIIENPELAKVMGESAKKFARPGADEKIAKELIGIALEHSK